MKNNLKLLKPFLLIFLGCCLANAQTKKQCEYMIEKEWRTE
jgi:hypothetical protein